MSQPLIIIQARLSSTRLPGKVLMPFANGQSILDIQVEMVRQVLPDHQLVIATTTNPADDKLVAYGKLNTVPVFRGSEDDVLQRFIDCAHDFGATELVRICSDNPFLMGEELLEVADANRTSDYFSFKNSENVPAIKTHWGLFAEYVKSEALERAAHHTSESIYHEHVTNFIYGHPDQFTIHLKFAPNAVVSRGDLRFTIDTQADFKTCQQIYAAWDKQSLNSLVTLVDENESWLKAMKGGIAQFTK